MGFSIGYDEGYKCFDCNITYELDEANDSGWKCPTCGEYILIAAPRLCSGQTKIRKKAIEVVKNDSINIAGINDINDVLGITELENGRLRIGLKNYGTIFVDPNDFVDVVIGAYNKSSWI